MADLYIRVSTNEQADKGYSQRDQEERLRKYCEINSLQVRKVVFEDHSAKTFDRPAWAKLLAELRKHRGHSDLVLFTKCSISQLDVLYENGTVAQKRKIIGSMFPEKLTFDGFQYRTTRVNEDHLGLCC